MTAPPPARRPSRTGTIAIVGAVVVGVALLGYAAWLLSRPTTFGWFAYAPLSDETFSPSGAYPPGLAALVAAVGALLLGLVGGFALGRRGRVAPRGGVAASDDV